MRRLFLHAAVIPVLACLTLSTQAAELRTDAFKIEVPGDFTPFEKRSDVQESPDGTIATTMWITKSASTGEAMIVSQSTMPRRILDTQKLFDTTRDALLASLNGTVETDENAGSALAARRLFFRTPRSFIRARLVAAGDRLYQFLYVARSSEQRQSPVVSQIFSSVEVASK